MTDLHAFGVPCAIVELSEKLRKLDDRARMCVFIGYKYGGGGYRVWDPRRSVVVKSRDVIFFEDGLPTPTYRELAVQADELFVQPSLGCPAAPVPSVATQPPVLPSVPSSVPATTAVPLPQAVQESQRLMIKLLGHYMGTGRHCMDALEGGDTGSADSTDDDGVMLCEHPMHDVGYMPDYPAGSLWSGHKHDCYRTTF